MGATPHAPLTLPHLQRLARLHRQGVDGAGGQLALLLNQHPEEVLDSLGISHDKLPRLLKVESPVDALVDAIEAYPGVVRRRKADDELKRARELAVQLGRTATWCGDHIVLSIDDFVDLALTTGYGQLAFAMDDEVRAIDRRLIARMLRECRRAQLETITLTPNALTLTYNTLYSRGRIGFLMRPALLDDSVVVELDRPSPARRGAPRGFLDHLLTAVADVSS